ncbi:hypothetical protein ES708_23789 [subsurface metagenome]
MKAGMRKLYSGDFNTMSQERLSDGTVIITLAKEGEGVSYRFKVKDLYGEHEEVLDHKIMPNKPPKWIRDRMKEATDHAGKDKG